MLTVYKKIVICKSGNIYFIKKRKSYLFFFFINKKYRYLYFMVQLVMFLFISFNVHMILFSAFVIHKHKNQIIAIRQCTNTYTVITKMKAELNFFFSFTVFFNSTVLAKFLCTIFSISTINMKIFQQFNFKMVSL